MNTLPGRAGFLALALSLAVAAHAQQPANPPVPAAPDAELEGLLKILSEETAVATRTRMNGDYVPGIVTVLHGDELAELGARTVWDALSLVPGIEAVRDSTGLPSLIVRGTQFPFNSGNVKVLIDSTKVAFDNAGINSIVLDLPIQLVDRIEVIRGPGSVVYGDFAYMGLIHIVTRKTGRGLYARPEEGGAFSGGAFGGGRTKGGVDYSVSASGFSGGPTEVPGRRDVDDTRGLAFGSLAYRGFSLSASVLSREVKDRSMAPISGQQTHTAADVRYARELSKDTQLELRLNERNSRFRSNASDLDGSVVEGGASLQWKGASRQSWLFDASLTHTNIENAVFKVPAITAMPTPTPPPPGSPPPPPPPLSPLGFTVHDESLIFTSLMAQNTIDASAKVSITLGARFDKYGDVDQRLTPRASLVYRASDRNIVKAQYAEGFRAPTFFELYSRGLRYTNLDFEVNGTTEINFVHRRPETVFRLTAYWSSLKDLIYVLGADEKRHSIFENARKARVFGTELEIEHELGRKLKAVANLSWFDTRDSRSADGLFIKRDSVPRLMGNIAIIAAPAPKTRLTARFHYVGDRGAATLKAYTEIEATATQKGVLVRGLDLRGGVRFSSGKGVLYPMVLPTMTTAVGYEFPKAFAELSWSR